MKFVKNSSYPFVFITRNENLDFIKKNKDSFII